MYSKTSLANRALDILGKQTVLDLDADTSPVGKLMARNYTPVMLRCLRKSEWPFAIKRLGLNPNVTAPVNEYSYAFDVPSDMVKLLRVFPDTIRYKIEQGKILCDESSITVKYVSDDIIEDPSDIDSVFAEWFSHELAVSVAIAITDSAELRAEIRKAAQELFKEAAAIYSQEDIDDPGFESPWVSCRNSDLTLRDDIRIRGLE